MLHTRACAIATNFWRAFYQLQTIPVIHSQDMERLIALRNLLSEEERRVFGYFQPNFSPPPMPAYHMPMIPPIPLLPMPPPQYNIGHYQGATNTPQYNIGHYQGATNTVQMPIQALLDITTTRPVSMSNQSNPSVHDRIGSNPAATPRFVWSSTFKNGANDTNQPPERPPNSRYNNHQPRRGTPYRQRRYNRPAPYRKPKPSAAQRSAAQLNAQPSAPPPPAQRQWTRKEGKHEIIPFNAQELIKQMDYNLVPSDAKCVIIGDSIVQCITGMIDCQVLCYPGLTMTKLHVLLKADKIPELRGKLICLLHMGTNDLDQGLKTYQIMSTTRSVSQLINTNYPQCRVIISQVLPRPFDKDWSERPIQRLSIAMSNEVKNWNAYYVHLRDKFAKKAYIHFNLYFPDGLHLNTSGTLVLKNSLQEAIDVHIKDLGLETTTSTFGDVCRRPGFLQVIDGEKERPVEKMKVD